MLNNNSTWLSSKGHRFLETIPCSCFFWMLVITNSCWLQIIFFFLLLWEFHTFIECVSIICICHYSLLTPPGIPTPSLSWPPYALFLQLLLLASLWVQLRLLIISEVCGRLLSLVTPEYCALFKNRWPSCQSVQSRCGNKLLDIHTFIFWKMCLSWKQELWPIFLKTNNSLCLKLSFNFMNCTSDSCIRSTYPCNGIFPQPLMPPVYLIIWYKGKQNLDNSLCK